MALFKTKEAVGLDIGHGAVKAVRLVLKGKSELAIEKMALLDVQQEGLLDEDELRRGLVAWLGENSLKDRAFTVGIPQYLATTQISDFPPGVKGDELSGMVSFETMQLAGLSDEAFSSDYHVMAPKFGRQNPVLIGVCRQSVIDERMRMLTSEGLNVVELGMNGLALASALFHLHPDVTGENRPSLVLDLGEENTTLLVLVGGQVLFAGTLPFGASRYTEVLAGHLRCDDLEADRRKRTLTLDPNDPDHPLHAVTAQLESEMRNAIEHWRSGEQEEIAHLLFAKIWLTGGGAALGGLADALGRFFGCEVALFGPADPESGQPVPSMTTAFGLALQGFGAAAVPVSLSPESLRWRQRRKRLFPYLLAAEVVFALLLAGGMISFYSRLAREKVSLDAQVEELRQCRTLIPQLKSQMTAMDHHERMLIPFVERGNRGRRFLDTIAELEKSRGDKDFFVFLADRFSFDDMRPKESDSTPGARPARPTASEGMGMFGIASVEEARRSRDTAVLNATLVDEMAILPSMVVAGYIPYQVEARYGPMLAMVDKLNQGSLFQGVDIVQERGLEEQIFNVWERFWRERPSKGRFTQFMFNLPFANRDVTIAAPEAATRTKR